MYNQFRLTQQAAEALANNYGTPLLVLSTRQIESNYDFLRNHLPGVTIHYAVKSNPAARIVDTLAQLGSHFDVASDGEMEQLTAQGVAPERMIYANPVKTIRGLATASRLGIHTFTFDSESEIGKMAREVPGGRVLLRVRVENSDALVDLNKKFGALPSEALRLLRMAHEQGLDTAGLCFHVGSQSHSAQPYIEAIKVCRSLFDQALAAGLPMRILDIGGGFPIPAGENPVDAGQMCDQISDALRQHFAGVEIWAEPGRFICGTAVNLLTRVIGSQVRNGKQWYFLDEGLYGSFSGAIFDHWEYEMESFKSDRKIPATFAGPSCDSMDVMYRDKLTAPLALDDLLVVIGCGAYTSASATVFNGFAKAPIIVWEDQEVIEKLRFRCAG